MSLPVAIPAESADGVLDEFDLDIEFVAAGATVDHIIRMTEDNCGSTCQSACVSC